MNAVMPDREILAAFVFRHFMQRQKHPELVLSCLFRLWRGQLARVRWSDADSKTEICKVDVEAAVPFPLESCTSAASFACMETLGVNPPPARGWVPQGGEKSDGGSPPAVEWYGNLESAEWIYHKTDDLYFHLPTSSLWEKRPLECRDPSMPSYTYYRTDAMHLQALRHFAESMASATLPMAFNAWVIHLKKQKRRASAKLAAEVPGRLIAVVSPAGVEHVAVSLTAAPDVSADIAYEGEALKPIPEVLEAVVALPPPPLSPLEHPHSDNEEWLQGLREDSPQPRCCLWISRGRKRKVEPSGVKRVDAPKGIPPRALESPAKECGSQLEAVPLDCASERHKRRMEQFFDDVKNNPTRLVSHVESRRLESTHVAFSLV